MAKKLAWFIRLGSVEWLRYTYTRADDDTLKLLGSVKRGPQMGALAMTAEGNYVQVVGDFITPLNKAQITRALTKVRAPESYPVQRVVPRTGPPPVVTVKRRRVFVVS